MNFQDVKDCMGDEEASVELMTKQPMDRLNKYLNEKSMAGKKWYTSRTIWLGSLTTLAGVIEFVIQYLQNEISITALALAVLGLVINALRLDTKDPIKKILK